MKGTDMNNFNAFVLGYALIRFGVIVYLLAAAAGVL